MTVEDVLTLVEAILKPGYLNHVQELVLRQSWEGKTYPDMAANSCYNAEYIKNIGYHLWQSLSEKLGEKVTKSNFRSVLRRYRCSQERETVELGTTNRKQNAGKKEDNAEPEATLFPPVSQKSSLASPLTAHVFTPVLERPSIPGESKEKREQCAIMRREKLAFQHNEPMGYRAANLPARNQVNKWGTTIEREWQKERATERENKSLKPQKSIFPISRHLSHPLRQDWEKAIDVSVFHGRTVELAKLERWIVAEQSRLVALLGMGGIGKTALCLKLAERISDQFEYIIWRSLRKAPPLTQLLATLVQFLSNQQQTEQPTTVAAQIQILMDYLRTHRCLLILDDVEAILRSGNEPLPDGDTRAGYYREGYEGYGELFQRIGEECHQSCLVLCSREQPKELAFLAGQKVRSLQLDGLSEEAVQQIFHKKGGSWELKSKWRDLNQMYQGNPLALKMVSTTIQDLFDGNVAEFLAQDTSVFGDIRELLTQQFKRLSDLEKEIMYWLAVYPEAVSMQELRRNMPSSSSTLDLLEALESLKRRCLIETRLGYFTQPSLVRDYMKHLLIKQIYKQRNYSYERGCANERDY